MRRTRWTSARGLGYSTTTRKLFYLQCIPFGEVSFSFLGHHHWFFIFPQDLSENFSQSKSEFLFLESSFQRYRSFDASQSICFWDC